MDIKGERHLEASSQIACLNNQSFGRTAFWKEEYIWGAHQYVCSVYPVERAIKGNVGWIFNKQDTQVSNGNVLQNTAQATKSLTQYTNLIMIHK